MDEWDRGDVPGATSQRKRLEAADVTGEVSNDHYHKFVWKRVDRFARDKGGQFMRDKGGRFVRDTGGRFLRGGRHEGRITEEAVDHGFASIQNCPQATRGVHPEDVDLVISMRNL